MRGRNCRLDERESRIRRRVQAAAEIARSAQEQAGGLQQINTAINQMDHSTQQNATMVEESTAASHSLSKETTQLAGLVEQFQVGGDGNATALRAPRPATSDAVAVPSPIAKAG